MALCMVMARLNVQSNIVLIFLINAHLFTLNMLYCENINESCSYLTNLRMYVCYLPSDKLVSYNAFAKTMCTCDQ